MFWHSFKYAFRTLLKSRAMMFWTLIFPFILAILFNMAFARLHDYDVFEAFDVAVVDDENFRDSEIFKEAFKTLSEEGEEQLFVTQYVDSEKADQLLADEKVDGIVYIVDSEPHVKIKKNGTNQTVLTTAVEQIYQSSKIIEDIADTKINEAVSEMSPEQLMRGEMPDVEKIYKDAVATVSDAEPNVKDDSRVMNIVVIEFYTLIAMACMQGAMLSSEMMDRCLPNITSRGKRVAVAPTRKGIVIASNLLASYSILLLSLIALIAFMRFVLGVEFGSNLGFIILLAAVGGLASTVMGMMLSIVLKTNNAAKNVIILIITMVGCLFAGMFGGNKGFFDNLSPIINKISPVGMITDGFYSLYYYADLARYFSNIYGLLIVAAIFMILSIRGLRRQRYDSI